MWNALGDAHLRECSLYGFEGIGYSYGCSRSYVESYYEKLERIDGGRTRYYTNKFKEYATNDAYFYVRLEVPNTGLTKLMKIKFDENVVANVEVNKTEVVF